MIFYILIVNPHVIGDTNRQRNIEMKADAKKQANAESGFVAVAAVF
jgi:hypothetical protein